MRPVNDVRLINRMPYLLLFFLLIHAAAGLTAPVFAQTPNIGIGIILQNSDQAGVEFETTQADFTVRPSVTTSRIGAGTQTLDLVAFCFDAFTGAILPFCNLEISHERSPGSGGHDHDDASRPIGTFDPASGNTGDDGLLPVTYTAPEVSGIVRVTLTGTTQDGTPVTPSTATIGVEIGGLVALGTGTNYNLVGQTAQHGDNHYGVSGFNSSLAALADAYAEAFPGSKLDYNDMSLVTGGLFDISGAWSTPHSSHRFGVDLDLRLVSPDRRRRLRQLIVASGIATILVEGNHWHIRQ